MSLISETFQRCYLNDEKTGAVFLNLINSQQGDYSRYIFFYLNHLIDKNKINAAENVVSQFDYMNSTILLSQSKSWVENKKFKEFNKIFSCQNHKDVVSEFLFLDYSIRHPYILKVLLLMTLILGIYQIIFQELLHMKIKIILKH